MRMTHRMRRKSILEAALSVTRESGYFDLTRDKVAKEAGCSPSLVQFHFNASNELRVAVIEEANRLQDFVILSQIVGTLDPNVDLVWPDLVEPALKFIMEGLNGDTL